MTRSSFNFFANNLNKNSFVPVVPPFSFLQIPSTVLLLDGPDPYNDGIPPNDGDSVTIWKDMSVMGFDFDPPGVVNQPIYVANAFNGLGALRGDGIIQCMTKSYEPELNAADITIFGAFMPDPTGGYMTPFSSRIGPVTAGYNFYSIPNTKWEGWTGTGTASWDAVQDGTYEPGIFSILSMRATGGNAEFFINGVSFGTTTYVPMVGFDTNIFWIESAALFFRGLAGQIAICNSHLDDPTFYKAVNYMINRWRA